MSRNRLTAAACLAALIFVCPAYADDAPAYLAAWTSADCRGCHQVNDEIFSHPVDVSPSMAVPEGLPLEYGRVACTTCHTDNAAAHAAGRATGDNMLRPLAAKCSSCHTDAPAGSRAAHGIALGRAHYGWSNQGAFAGFGPKAKTESPLASDSSCLKCHDGSGAKSLGRSHPSNVPYRRTKLGKNVSPLIPAASLDDRIRLFDNNVTCNSCHSPFSDQPKFLVMPNRRGELCKSCHDM